MQVSDVSVTHHAGYSELSASVKIDTHWVWGDEAFPLWYRFPPSVSHHLHAGNGDPFLAALLAPAMLLGEPLIIEAEISPALLAAQGDIQDIYRRWSRRLVPVEVQSPVRATGSGTEDRPTAHGLFFSLGVDSCYSLLRSDGERASRTGGGITHLLNVLGFDIYLWESDRYPAVERNIAIVAQALGKEVVTVSTNLRELSDRVVDWVAIYHGAALASVGLALGSLFRRLVISATHTYAALAPLGSHPVLDPLWSTETLRFDHVGCEADRIEKIRRIAQSPVMLQTLRVCARDDLTGIYNCGACPKCLMTTIGLHVAGALQQCSTLPQTIDLDAIRRIPIRNSTQRVFLGDLLNVLGESAEDVAIRAAIAECLANAPPSFA